MAFFNTVISDKYQENESDKQHEVDESLQRVAFSILTAQYADKQRSNYHGRLYRCEPEQHILVYDQSDNQYSRNSEAHSR